MTKEQLLQPRYEVMEPYPDSPFYKGEILQLRYREHNGKVFGWEDSKRAAGIWDEDYFNKYPHIFRRLEWWEKRKEEDMPKYIKGVKDYFKNKMFKVADPSQNGRIWHIDNEIEHQTFIHYASSFEPVTEQEYKDYISSNKSK